MGIPRPANGRAGAHLDLRGTASGSLGLNHMLPTLLMTTGSLCGPALRHASVGSSKVAAMAHANGMSLRSEANIDSCMQACILAVLIGLSLPAQLLMTRAQQQRSPLIESSRRICGALQHRPAASSADLRLIQTTPRLRPRASYAS